MTLCGSVRVVFDTIVPNLVRWILIFDAVKFTCHSDRNRGGFFCFVFSISIEKGRSLKKELFHQLVKKGSLCGEWSKSGGHPPLPTPFYSV